MRYYLQTVNIESPHGPLPLATAMAPFQRRDFDILITAFEAVARGEKPPTGRIWWERTKGASKDTDLALALLWLLAYSRRVVDCQIGAADRDQADEIRKAAKGIIRCNAWLQDVIEINNYVIRNPKSGSRAVIEPADISGSHGSRPDLLILNELSHIRHEEFANNMLDNAAKVPNGLVCIATNAGFLDTWQWRLRKMVLASERWHFSAYTDVAPWLDPAEIEERRKSVSAYRFSRLWQGKWVPQIQEESEWPPECFGPEIWFDDWPADIRIRGIAIDPSKGRNAKHGDYSAIVMLAISGDGMLWGEADLARRPTEKIVEDGLEWYSKFKPDALTIESNSFQELLGKDFIRVAGQRAMQPNILLANNTVNKEVRIRRLTSAIMNRKIRFKAGSAGTELLVRQLQDFPFGDHDDGPDALEMGHRLLTQMATGRIRQGSLRDEPAVMTT